MTSTDTAHKRATWSHAAPFIAWVLLMACLGEPAGWKYAVRTVAGLALLVALKPWRWYAPLSIRHIPLAVVAGVLVFVFWIVGETSFAARFGELQDLYLKWGIMPFGKMPEVKGAVYAPDVHGWPLALARLAGSAFVISVIEEFFWRGFLYRWLTREKFLSVDLGKWHWRSVLIMSIAFGLMHHRWVVAFITGLVYAWVVVRTKDIWAGCIAHAVTNLLLGIYVLSTQSYAFW